MTDADNTKWVNVVRPGGEETVAVPEEEVPRLLGGGWVIETPEMRTARIRTEEYGGTLGATAAGALAVARNASLGLSDQALVKVGLSPSHIENLRIEHPEVTLAGEIAGSVLPAVVMKGRFTPAGAVSRLGMEVEKNVASAVARKVGAKSAESLSRKLLEKTASLAAAGSVEGAAQGLQQAITEDALGNLELSAETILAHARTGALWGAGGGAVLGFAAPLIKGGVSAIGKPFENMYTAATGMTPAKGLGRAVAKLSGAAIGRPSEDIAEAFARRSEWINKIDYDAAAREFADVARENNKAARELFDRFQGGLKIKGVEKLVKRGNEDDVAAALVKLISESRDSLKTIKENPGWYGAYGKNSARKAEELLATLEGKLTDAYRGNVAVAAKASAGTVVGRPAAAARAGGGFNAKAFELVDEAKRILAKIGAAPGKNLGAQELNSAQLFRDMYDTRFKQFLENADLFGDAAALQADVNRKYTKWLEKIKVYSEGFESFNGVEEWKPIYDVDPGKVKSYFQEILSAGSDRKRAALRAHNEGMAELAEAMARHVDTGGIDIGAIKKNANKMAEMAAKLEDKARLWAQVADLDKAGMDSAGVVGAVLGGLGGGLGGGLVGAIGLQSILKPTRAIRSLAMIERMSGGVLSGVKKSAESIKVPRAARGVIGKTVRAAAVPVAEKVGETKGAYKREAEKAIRRVSNPDALSANIVNNTEGLAEFAPKLQSAVAVKAVTAAQFLASKVPKSTRPSGVPAFGREWEPPEHEKAKFLRYVKAVEDPLSVMDDLVEGKISREGAEVLRSVYPELYAKVQVEIAAAAAELSESLDYSTRVQLSILTGVPVDQTMTQEFIMAMASVSGRGEEQQGQPAPSGQKVMTMPGKKVTLDDRLATKSADNAEA